MSRFDVIHAELVDDLHQLDCYTPGWARETWDHDRIIETISVRVAALLDVAEAAGRMVETPTDSAAEDAELDEAVRAALDRLQEVTG